MSKLYDNYLKLKEENNNKLYLFKSGNFYIFIDEDAKKINEITTLKLAKLNDNIVKCGFPGNALEKYKSIFKNLSIDFEIIEEVKLDKDSIIKKITNIDINSITPLKALNILSELKDMVDE